jgi:hypothetical protein
MRKKRMEKIPEVTPVPVYSPVTVIENRGPAVLVEYKKDGRLFRTIIPQEELINGQVDEYTLAALGIPYGLPWEEMIKMKSTPERLAEELRIRGIWTIEDLRRNQPVLFGAIQAVYGLDLAGLINAAETYVRGR